MDAVVQYRSSFSHQKFPIYGYVGAAVIVLAEVLLFSDVYLIGVYFTPIVWSGYILVLDALNYRVRHDSLLMIHRKEFFIMLLWSIACWCMFEAYNLYLQNWTYVGLPENTFLRLFGYVWSFATIFPAIFETAQFIGHVFHVENKKPLKFSKATHIVFIMIGSVCLVLPLLLPQSDSEKLFALVWVGFIFLLDPINYKLKGTSILRELESGSYTILVSLLMSGLVCGLLWEFWNYWAIAKWHYSVPISFVGPKLFEMPLLGYAGFLPFAVECFVMWHFLKSLFPSLFKFRSE